MGANSEGWPAMEGFEATALTFESRDLFPLTIAADNGRLLPNRL